MKKISIKSKSPISSKNIQSESIPDNDNSISNNSIIEHSPFKRFLAFIGFLIILFSIVGFVSYKVYEQYENYKDYQAAVKTRENVTIPLTLVSISPTRHHSFTLVFKTESNNFLAISTYKDQCIQKYKLNEPIEIPVVKWIKKGNEHYSFRNDIDICELTN